MISSFDIVKISLGRCPRDILLIYLIYQAIYYSFFIFPHGILNIMGGEPFSSSKLRGARVNISFLGIDIQRPDLGEIRYTSGPCFGKNIFLQIAAKVYFCIIFIFLLKRW